MRENRIWNDISATVAMLKSPGRRIAIITHVNPDGDALGSSLGLLLLFHKLGHTCRVISPNAYPAFLQWMPGSEHITVLDKTPETAVAWLKQADLIFAVDFNDLKRVKELNNVFSTSSAHKVLIDHHPGPDMKVDCTLSDIQSSSSAELVYRFIQEGCFLSLIDRDIASCLFAGIMTDTGCFSYNSSHKSTWTVVAELLDIGINKDRIYSLVYDNYSADRMRLLGFSLNEKMEIFPEYRTGLIWLSREDMERYHFAVGDSEGFVNYPLSIQGIRFSALFIQRDDHIRISFRSKGNFAVNEFSRKYFHGGGHVNASGGESYLSMEETVKRFKALLPTYKDKLSDYEE